MARERLTPPLLGSDKLARSIYDVVALQNGDLGSAVKYTAYDGSDWNLDVDSVETGTGSIARFQAGGVSHLEVTKNGITVTAITTGALTANGTLTANGNVVLGDAAADTVTVNGTPTFNAASTFRHNVTIQNAAATVLALFDVTAGAQVARLGSALAPGLYVDVANGRTLIGTATALTTAANDKFAVVGGTSYFAGAPAIGIRHGAAEAAGWLIGASAAGANPALVFLDDGGAETFRLGDTSATYQAIVTGDFRVTDDAVVGGDVSCDRLVVGATAFSGSERLRAVGDSLLEGETSLVGDVNIGADGSSTHIVNGNLHCNHGVQVDGTLYINDTSNAFQSAGVTINQGAFDDEILTFKSSDVAQGATSVTESDTFALFRKADAGGGGLLIQGFQDTGAFGLIFRGVGAAANTTKATTSVGAVVVDGAIVSGSGIGSLGANGNLAVFRDQTTARFILDADGDSHQDVGTAWTNFDTHDDIGVLTRMSYELARPGNQIREEFGQFLTESRASLERAGLVQFNEDGHHFVNMSRLTMLLVGAVRQSALRIAGLESRLAALTGAGEGGERAWH